MIRISTRTKRMRSLVMGFLSIICLFGAPSYAGNLKIGAAAVKITPPLGIPLAGQYFDRGAEAIHDDLYAKAMVIESEGTRIAIVSCDLVEVTSELVSKARSTAAKLTGIAPDHIMVSATHSHTGPILSSGSTMYTVKGKTAELLDHYLANLPGLIAESILKANEALRPAGISFGLGHEESISYNRRFFMKDGTVGWNPGKLNPMIIKPAGPIDPEVSVLYAESPAGEAIATYVNFALHLDITGGLEISADLPFTLSSILGTFKSPGMITLFGQGCCGNINHINVNSEKPQFGHVEAQRIGTVLAGEVVKTYTRLEPLVVDKISTRDEIVKLPLAEILATELPKAREIAARFGQPEAAPFMEMVNAYKVIGVFERKGRPLDAEIQVMALGEKCAIVSLPGEIFTELGMYIKSRSPFSYTMVVELANGSIDYVPDRKAFVEGNYEPVSARCAPGSGEILVEKALQLLNDLKNSEK
jgi:neutral ceramidase